MRLIKPQTNAENNDIRQGIREPSEIPEGSQARFVNAIISTAIMVKVKICGLSRPCDIDAVNAETPDFVGFVFAESRRRVTPQQARELRSRLYSGFVPAVVFFVETPETIVSLVRDGIIDIVQLHGSEDELYIETLKFLTDAPVIKAVAVQTADDVKKWATTSADYLLFDNKTGGSGETFDWGVVINQTDQSDQSDPTVRQQTQPFFLAGGLNAANITRAIETLKPFAVDASSGVETDGFKDPAKIREFIRRARHD